MDQSNYRKIFVEGYPPQDHMIRDLQVSLEVDGTGLSTIRAPVVPEICTDQGAMYVGVMATLVDILGGGLSIMAVSPDWSATSGLSIHTTGRATSGEVAATGSVIRTGRTMIVVSVDIYEVTGNSALKSKAIGSAMIDFSRLPRRKDTLEIVIDEGAAEAFQFAVEGSGLIRPYLDEVGMRVLNETAGVVELKMSDYIRNSFRSLQGGIVAILADVAGQHAARAATGKPLITSDLLIHFISQGKVGPFRTKAEVLRAKENTALTRIEVIDTGADDRLITVAMNTATVDD
jgi:uncharacterized protein (TIGR00369 family)